MYWKAITNFKRVNEEFKKTYETETAPVQESERQVIAGVSDEASIRAMMAEQMAKDEPTLVPGSDVTKVYGPFEKYEDALNAKD